MLPRFAPPLALLALGAAAACVGTIGGDGPGAGGISEEVQNEVGPSGLRRLTLDEYNATVLDLLGVAADSAAQLLPEDPLVPFDNDYTLQTASEGVIKGVELLAGDLANAIIVDSALRTKITGCEPASASDEDCFRSFLESFGRRALRRPLSAEDVDRFAKLQSFGVEADDFWVGVGAALRAFLQHPEFLYRVEIGEPVEGSAGVFRLNSYEVATRLSYFLIGTTPPDTLLDAAASGQLDSAQGVAEAAADLLANNRSPARVARFHALWLSYSPLGREGLAGDMHKETEALLERVVFSEKRPWTDLLTATETYLTPELASHYELPAPDGKTAWVDYGDSGRKGIFSHGTFLSAGAKFGDTSPTQRGLLIRTRLFCETIPLPPPNLMVDVDEPPGVDPDACKTERYFMAKEKACSGCHLLMDPIGFGLESYDATGRFRETEPNKPECVIDGEGTFSGVGDFNGPDGLADLALSTGRVEACLVTQMYRYAVGRTELEAHDEALIARLATVSSEGGLRLDTFMINYVTSDAFRLRRDEEVSP